jgi:hypothetical protein
MKSVCQHTSIPTPHILEEGKLSDRGLGYFKINQVQSEILLQAWNSIQSLCALERKEIRQGSDRVPAGLLRIRMLGIVLPLTLSRTNVTSMMGNFETYGKSSLGQY